MRHAAATPHSRNGPPPRLLAEAEHATAPRSGAAAATSMRARRHNKTSRATGRSLASWPRPSTRRRP
eukprot:12978963-Alexandrium_andersonii.AAC.1